MKANVFNKIKDKLRYINVISGAYKRRLKDQERLLSESLGWITINAKKLESIQNMQVLMGDTSGIDKTYTGNSWKTYEAATSEIKDRYTCAADWGVSITGPIVDIRASLISGDKVNVKKDKENEKDGDWIDEFLKVNGIGDYRLMEMVTSTEIEGRLLWTLRFDKDHEWTSGTTKKMGMVKVTPVLWINDKYDVEVDDSNIPDKIVFADNEKQDIESDKFVYRKFGGLMGDVNEPVQKVWRTLTYSEAAEKCLRDLRGINKLYASPRPVFKCKDKEEVKLVLDWLAKNPNWKIGMPFVTSAEFSYVQPNIDHVLMLIKEYYINIQAISAITGIPVHWLSLVDLMSNRATADDLGDITELAVSTERQVVTSALNELVKKAAILQTEETKQTAIDYSSFEISLSVITDEHWKRLKDTWMPAAIAKLIPTKIFLDKLPDVDAEEAYSDLEKQNREDAAYMFKEDTTPPDEENVEEDKDE